MKDRIDENRGLDIHMHLVITKAALFGAAFYQIVTYLYSLCSLPFDRVAAAKVLNAKVLESLDHRCPAVSREGRPMGNHAAIAIGEGLWRFTQHVHETRFPQLFITLFAS